MPGLVLDQGLDPVHEDHVAGVRVPGDQVASVGPPLSVPQCLLAAQITIYPENRL